MLGISYTDTHHMPYHLLHWICVDKYYTLRLKSLKNSDSLVSLNKPMYYNNVIISNHVLQWYSLIKPIYIM